ncbi:MAG: universal stress protein, partial [Acidimicrobiia bacterium]
MLVGTDGSSTAAVAEAAAARIATTLGAELVIISAYDEDPSTAQKNVDRAQASAREMGAEASAKVVKGPPADVIVETGESELAELIVVGNKGMAGSKRALLG